MGEEFEVFEAVAEGDRAGWSGFWIAVPSAELGNDPRSPSKRCRQMRVLLQRGLAFEFRPECVEGLRQTRGDSVSPDGYLQSDVSGLCWLSRDSIGLLSRFSIL